MPSGHIALAQFTTAALACAANPAYADPDNGSPFQVLKLYSMVEDKQSARAILALLGAFGMEIDGVQRQMMGWEEWMITTRIDARAHFGTVRKAINCHQSQLTGFGSLLALPDETLAPVFGLRAFVRVFSLVNGGRATETDLFEGLRV